MFSSIKSKIIFFIALIMAVTAATVMYFTHRDVGLAMLRKEEVLAKNVLRMVELNIKGGYQKLLTNRLNTILRHKTQLKDLTAIASSIIGEFAALFKSGRLTEEEAQKKALDWLRSVKLKNESNWFVIDRNSKIISHPDSTLEGMSITSIRDMKGRLITDVISKNFNKYGGDFAVFQWNYGGKKQKSKTLGYFISFPEWKWSIGSVIDISEVEAEAKRELDKIIKVLSKTFSRIKIAETGFAFLFDGNGEMLILADKEMNHVYKSARNLLTGNALLSDLMNASKRENNFVRYIAPNFRDADEMIAYISYFKTLDWYIVVTVPVREIGLPAKALVTSQSYIIGIIFLGSLIIASILVTKISKPLNMLSAYVKEFSSHDFTADDDKEHPIDSLPARYKDEVGRLAESFVFMRTELKKNILSLMETTAAKERIESELNVAREIQMGILPKTFPPFPEYNEFDLYAILEPAKEVGGDLYDFFLIDDDHLCFTLGDVSDKGVPAALFMVITRTLIKTTAKKGLPPAGIMNEINNIISADNPRSMFVTLLIGILNIRTGEICYANGGHNPPVVINRKKGVRYKKELSGTVVGAIEDLSYRELSLTLRPGDAIFLYTDGVTEAMNSERNLFSGERLLEEVEPLREKPVETVIHGINLKVKEFAGSAPQSDDIAMMMIRYNGNTL